MSDRPDGNQFDPNDLKINQKSKRVEYKGKIIYLSEILFKMLARIHAAAPDVVQRRKIFDAVWGHKKDGAGDTNFDKARRRLDTKLFPYGLAVRNEPHLGYRIERIQGKDSPLQIESPNSTNHKYSADTTAAVESLKTNSAEARPDERAKVRASASAILKGPEHLSLSSILRSQTKDNIQEWADFVLEVSKPQKDTLRFAEKFNATDRRIIGPVIEVFGHPFLESNLALAETGWSPDQVSLVDGGELDTSSIASDPRVEEAFKDAEALRKAKGKGTALQLPNNGKYAIADTSTPFHDISNLTLTFKRTDYFSILRSRPAINRFPDIWMKYGDVHPSGNQIPQAAGIQFSAIFGGREILVIQRDKDTFPFPGTWSFSGEEQLDKSDFQWDEPDRMKCAMLRTAQEEIFPLARIYDKAKLMEAMKVVESYIRSMRMWSMFLEGPTATYSVFCVYEFAFRVDEYADLVRGLVRRGLGQTSREGGYFSVNLVDVPRLLQGDDVPAVPIFGGEPMLIQPNELHPTSRYRLVRLLNVLRNQS